MKIIRLVNPKTGRESCAKAWTIEPKAILAELKNGTISSAKDISWRMLNEPESIETMEEEGSGDHAGNNFALAAFEHALDWTLGLTALAFIRRTLTQTNGKKIPKPFQVVAFRNGTVCILSASGKIY